MKNNQNGRAAMHLLFLIALFGTFLISALFIVLFGARIYNNIVDDTDRSFFTRTSLAYVTEKIHQHDESDCVSVFTFEENNQVGLKLLQNIGDTAYCTYFYPYDGYLKEITVPADTAFDPAFGSNVVPITKFIAEEDGYGLFHFVMEDEQSHSIDFYINIDSNRKGGALYE